MSEKERKGGSGALRWEADQVFREGRVMGQVQTADGYHGRMFSVRFGRENPRMPDSLTPYLEARDIPSLRVVLDQVDDYFRDKKAEQLRDRFPPRTPERSRGA